MNDTVIFLVLAGIALVFKWLTKQAAKDKEKPTSSSPNEPAQRPPPQSDEERVRRFLEALGAPPGSAPPPPVRPRQVVPRRVVTPAAPAPREVRNRKWEQPLPPLTSAPLPPPIVTEVPLPPAPIPLPLAPPVSLPLAPPIPASRTASAPRLAPVVSLGELLRRRGSVRQAVVLREVLGPPRGLQPRVMPAGTAQTVSPLMSGRAARSLHKYRYIRPPTIPPMIGMTQKNHSW